MENVTPDTSPPSESSDTETAASPDATGISWGIDKDGIAGRGVGVGLGVAVNTATSAGGGFRTDPPMVRPSHGSPRESKKDAGGSLENHTGVVAPIESAPQVIAKVSSTTTPSGNDRNGAAISTMTMSISPSVSRVSWESATVKANGTVKRAASGNPFMSESAGSKLMQDSE